MITESVLYCLFLSMVWTLWEYLGNVEQVQSSLFLQLYNINCTSWTSLFSVQCVALVWKE